FARFLAPVSIAADTNMNLFVADASGQTVRMISPSGPDWVVTTVAGLPDFPGSEDGTGSAAHFNNPGGIAVDSAGKLYVADTDNNTIRLRVPGISGPITLSISQADGAVVLSWPADAVGYELESSSSPLFSGSWVPVAGTPVIQGSDQMLTNKTSDEATFYR